jgi:hypothetical protein
LDLCQYEDEIFNQEQLRGAPGASLHDELEAEPVRIRPDHPSLDDYLFSGFVGKPQGDDLLNAKSFAGGDENPFSWKHVAKSVHLISIGQSSLKLYCFAVEFGWESH